MTATSHSADTSQAAHLKPPPKGPSEEKPGGHRARRRQKDRWKLEESGVRELLITSCQMMIWGESVVDWQECEDAILVEVDVEVFCGEI